MIGALRLSGRGFVYVFLTAANVYQIAHQHYAGMFVMGTLISALWWGNARHSSQATVPYAGLWYGLGAGLGTVCGTAIMAWWYG